MALLGAENIPLWFHSDQGSEYTSADVEQLLMQQGIGISHSPKSSPWRNGSQESFFGRFKIECGDLERFKTLPELMEAIYCHVAYYNTQRIHSAHRAPPSIARERYQQLNTTCPHVMSLPRRVASQRSPLPLLRSGDQYATAII